MVTLGVCLAGMLATLCAADPLPGTWTFSEGAEFPGAKGAITQTKDGGVTMQYDFTGGGNYVGAYFTFAQPQVLEAVRFRVRKGAVESMTFRATGADGQTFQRSVMEYEESGWQTLQADMKGWTAWWGGTKDGVLRQPILSVGMLVDNEDLDEAKGEIGIGAIQSATPRSGAAENIKEEPYTGEYVVTNFADDAGFSADPAAPVKNGLWRIPFDQRESASLGHSLSLFGKPEKLMIRVKASAPGAELGISLGSHFQAFTRTLGTLDGTEQTFSVTMPPDGWVHSGAAEDSISYPLRISSLTVSRGTAAATPIDVRLLDARCLTVLPHERAVQLMARVRETLLAGHMRTLRATCSGWNPLDANLDGTLIFTVRDWDGNVLHTEQKPWTLAARGEKGVAEWNVQVPAALNFTEAEFVFDAPGQRPASARASVTQPLRDPGDTTLRPELPWGMGVYLYRYGDGADDHKRMDRAAALAQAAGVKWSREEFSWATTEPRKGEFDFHYYDTVVDTALRHGISVYGLMSYWSNWTKPYTEEGVDDFCVWARALVAHFKDRVKYWEIYNEPNIFFWDGPKDLYPVLVKKCYAAIKETDPEATVLAISTSGIDRAFIKKCLQANAPFDVLTVHPYRNKLNDSGFVREMRDVAALVGNRPVWITEMGWPTQIGGTTERTQASLLSRCYLSAVASGACQNISWYDFRDDGNDPFYNESNFGVLYEDMRPKPGYRALATLCHTFAKASPTLVETGSKDLFAVRAGDAWAFWCLRAPASLSFRCADDADIRNLMGEPVKPERKGRKTTLALTPENPVFVQGALKRLHWDRPKIGEEADVVAF